MIEQPLSPRAASASGKPGARRGGTGADTAGLGQSPARTASGEGATPAPGRTSSAAAPPCPTPDDAPGGPRGDRAGGFALGVSRGSPWLAGRKRGVIRDAWGGSYTLAGRGRLRFAAPCAPFPELGLRESGVSTALGGFDAARDRDGDDSRLGDATASLG